jgi:hypothetical protein
MVVCVASGEPALVTKESDAGFPIGLGVDKSIPPLPTCVFAAVAAVRLPAVTAIMVRRDMGFTNGFMTFLLNGMVRTSHLARIDLCGREYGRNDSSSKFIVQVCNELRRFHEVRLDGNC